MHLMPLGLCRARARAAMSEDDVLDDDADRGMEQACVVKDR